MNVHLLRSAEVDPDTYTNVLHLLQRFRGPVRFLEAEAAIEPDVALKSKIWRNKKQFETMPDLNFNACHSEAISFPYEERVKSWEEFFGICKRYRNENNVAQDDLIILLTDIANDQNWFGAVSPRMTDYFVHTANWHHYFGNSVDIRFPIAYEVAIWVQRYYMFANREEIMRNIHLEPLGCINDFCQDKSQIVLKMRTADMCERCMNKLIENDVPVLLCRQFFDILDGIRTNMTFRERSVLLHRPSRVEVRGHTKKIFFTDLGDLELPLNPKEKALYLLFLNHPEGIHLSAISDHSEELKLLYGSFCNQGEPQSIDEAIALLINPLDNDINVVLSRIKRKLLQAVGESLLKFYCIDGERGSSKRIVLDREMVNYC